jgi:threonine/homoserine/homoserine lactone efflux protein
MFPIIICFVVAAVISFIGSLQLGPVNLCVIHTAINSNFKSSLMVALGGCLPEIIYASIAFFATEYLLQFKLLVFVFQLFSIALFLCFGVFSFFKINKKANKQNVANSFFIKGFLLGIANPMLITFWLSIILFLNQTSYVYLHTTSVKIAFIFGTAVGAFLLLYSFAIFIRKNRTFFSESATQKLNKTIGILFIILAIIQFLKLI